MFTILLDYLFMMLHASEFDKKILLLEKAKNKFYEEKLK